MENRKVKIRLEDGESVSGIVSGPGKGKSRAGIVIAHGAANDMNHPYIVSVANFLADAGMTVLRFNFLYREKMKKSPDSEKRLTSTWIQVFSFMKKKILPEAALYIAAGKSLGCRIASQAVSEGTLVPDALIFLGYPLHAPGRKENIKDAHLYAIDRPMLFIEGTRDPFCDAVSFKNVYAKLKGDKAVEWIEGGNHSCELAGTEKGGQDAVYRQIGKRCRSWIETLENNRRY